MVRLGGFEPPTLSLGRSGSIQLSYSRSERQDYTTFGVVVATCIIGRLQPPRRQYLISDVTE